MGDKPENKIDLSLSVSEQIADMQLMYLRQAALNRVLSFDEIKTLEILTKVKNVEEEKRADPQTPIEKKAQRIKELAASIPANVLEISKKEVPKDDAQKADPSESKRTS